MAKLLMTFCMTTALLAPVALLAQSRPTAASGVAASSQSIEPRDAARAQSRLGANATRFSRQNPESRADLGSSYASGNYSSGSCQ